MSLQTKPTQLEGKGGQISKIATLSDKQIPSGISAHESITNASAGYTATGVPYFSVIPREDGNIELRTYGDGVTCVYPAQIGVPIIGIFTEIVAAGTDIDSVIAFV